MKEKRGVLRRVMVAGHGFIRTVADYRLGSRTGRGQAPSPVLLKAPGTPAFPFSVPKGGWSAGRRPGAGEAPLAELARLHCAPDFGNGVANPVPRRARLLRQVCEACRPGAAPPGAPPAVLGLGPRAATAPARKTPHECVPRPAVSHENKAASGSGDKFCKIFLKLCRGCIIPPAWPPPPRHRPPLAPWPSSPPSAPTRSSPRTAATAAAPATSG